MPDYKALVGLEQYSDGQTTMMMSRQWLDRILAEVSTLAELKVILFIYLHTYGRDINFCSISITEFMDGVTNKRGQRFSHGLGLARQHVIRALNSAEEHGHIFIYKNRVNGKQRKWYFLNTPDNAKLFEALNSGSVAIETLMERQRQNLLLQRLGMEK